MKDAGRKKVEKLIITEDNLKSYIENYPVALQAVADLVTKEQHKC